MMVTLESGEETIYAVDTQSGQMQNQETHVLLEDGSVWKKRPICLPSAVWLLSVMVGEMSGSPLVSQSLSGHCWIFRPIEFV